MMSNLILHVLAGILLLIPFDMLNPVHGHSNPEADGAWLELVFRIDSIGNGYSSPTVTDSMIFLTGESDSAGYIMAFSLKGERIWKRCYGPEWTTSYRGSRAAPVYDNGKVYVSSGMGNIVCYDAVSGNEIWKVNLIEEYQGINSDYGYSMPVLIHQNYLYCIPGGEEHNIIALDKQSGNLIWSSGGTGETAAYAPPILIEWAGLKIFTGFTEFTFFGLDALTGTKLWDYGLNFKGELPCNMPLFEDGMIYIVAGPGNGAKGFILSEDGRSISHVWENLDLNSAFGSFVSTGTYLAGCADFKQSFLLVNKETGKTESQVKTGKGAIIRTEGQLIAYTHRGEVLKLEVDSDRLKITQRHRIAGGTGEHFTLPVYKDKLYIRHGQSLIAYSMI